MDADKRELTKIEMIISVISRGFAVKKVKREVRK